MIEEMIAACILIGLATFTGSLLGAAHHSETYRRVKRGFPFTRARARQKR